MSMNVNDSSSFPTSKIPEEGVTTHELADRIHKITESTDDDELTGIVSDLRTLRDENPSEFKEVVKESIKAPPEHFQRLMAGLKNQSPQDFTKFIGYLGKQHFDLLKKLCLAWGNEVPAKEIWDLRREEPKIKELIKELKAQGGDTVAAMFETLEKEKEINQNGQLIKDELLGKLEKDPDLPIKYNKTTKEIEAVKGLSGIFCRFLPALYEWIHNDSSDAAFGRRSIMMGINKDLKSVDKLSPQDKKFIQLYNDTADKLNNRQFASLSFGIYSKQTKKNMKTLLQKEIKFIDDNNILKGGSGGQISFHMDPHGKIHTSGLKEGEQLSAGWIDCCVKNCGGGGDGKVSSENSNTT